jgi:uncharacterized membrane protein
MRTEHIGNATFSLEAAAVFDAGRELWRYYHSQPKANAAAKKRKAESYYCETRAHKHGWCTLKHNVHDPACENYKIFCPVRPKYNVNASLYDIKTFFQGVDENGRMNRKSDDEEYNRLIGDLNEKMKILEKKIEPKVYEYGFLKSP